MGLFSRNTERLKAIMELLEQEQEARIESQQLVFELLEKAGKKQARTEAMCEDILETLSEQNEPSRGVPQELFFGMMEYFELLLRYCVRSQDEAVDSLLSEYGIERIYEAGVPANPELHKIEHIEEPPAPELDKTVASILTSGYRIGNRVLQKAKITAYIQNNGVSGL